jgi:hypothetical protein
MFRNAVVDSYFLYKLVAMVCNSIITLCAVCQNPNICESCLTDAHFEGALCKCNARRISTIINFVEFCQLCHNGCDTCVDLTSCSSCSLNDFRQLNSGNILCECLSGYYDIGS